MDDVDALRDARVLLARARETLRRLQARAPGLTVAMRWRSRSADEFADALAEWTDLLRRIDAELEGWDGILAQRLTRAVTDAALGDAG